MKASIDKIVEAVAKEVAETFNKGLYSGSTTYYLHDDGIEKLQQHIKETMVAQVALTIPIEVINAIAEESSNN